MDFHFSSQDEQPGEISWELELSFSFKIYSAVIPKTFVTLTFIIKNDKS